MIDATIAKLEQANADQQKKLEQAQRRIRELETELGELRKNAVVLPCKVGDTVWHKIGEHVFKVQRIELWPDDRIVFRCGNDGTEDYMCFFADEIGETVLIGEEAEAALRRAEGC